MIGTFTPFLGPILEILNKVIPDPAERAKLANQFQEAVLEADARMAEAQAKIITAEAVGTGMQRNWRPVFMYVCMGLLVWHAVGVPIVAGVLGVPMNSIIGLNEIPENLWTLLIIGMGGYIGARSLEKIAKNVKK